MREFKKLPLELFIGYDIEQNSRVIELDASEMVEQYPSGILQLVCKRPGEETTYIAPSFEQDGGTLRWTLTSYDVEKAGQGLAIVALVDTSEESVKVLASHKIRTGIEEGLHFRDAETVDPEDSLIARVLAAVSQAQAYAQDAKEEADRAEAALDDVEDAKDQAISAIETKGAETLDSIPSDYTALSGDVSDLKSNISQKVDAGYVENGVAHFTGDGNELFTITGVGGEELSADAKNALLACFRNVAWIGDDGQAYYDALEEALNPSRSVTGISAVFNQGSAVIYDTAELNDLRQYLTVTATYDDGSTKEISDYTLSGTLTAGTSTITATYEGKTATFNVTVTHKPATLQSISASFNQGSNVVYDDATLDSLKQYLTVTAHYSDGTTAVVTEYTLSGSLSVGTSTITATHEGLTDTFTVVVTAKPRAIYRLPQEMEFDGKTHYDTGVKLHENDIDYTVTIDFSTEDDRALQRTVLHCMHEASPYHGLIIDLTKEKARVAYSQHSNEVARVKVPYSEKIVITHAAGNNAYKYYRYNSNKHNETGTIDYNFVSISESIWLGSYRTTAGSPGRYFIGTISDFVIYNYAWTEEEVNAYLQEDHS